jgi:inositol-phosphate phosphatase/L-galactose 1-phosphate phosphatase/histidinol-phosphatase
VTGHSDTVADELLALAVRLADEAGQVARRYFRQNLTVEQKSDASPVTVADREAETVMRALIEDSFPDHGIVGEEFGAETKDARFVWVLDPIDGTKRFITGNALFGCLIALLDDGRPVLGVIDMPILEERWIGAAGRPTSHRDRRGQRQVATRSCQALDQAALYATSPQMFEGADFDGFEAVRRQTRQTSYGGECYSYGLLASGFLDLVIEADMGVYDFLPLVPVVTSAGGLMTDWQGQPLGLHSDGRVVAAGDRRVHAAALAELALG